MHLSGSGCSIPALSSGPHRAWACAVDRSSADPRSVQAAPLWRWGSGPSRRRVAVAGGNRQKRGQVHLSDSVNGSHLARLGAGLTLSQSEGPFSSGEKASVQASAHG